MDFKTVWEPPGGVVNRDETPDQAVLREFREETGLVAEIAAFLGSVVFKDKKNVNALFYLLRANSDTVRLGDPEHLQWKFFTSDELESLQNPSLTLVAALKLAHVRGHLKIKTGRWGEWEGELFVPR